MVQLYVKHTDNNFYLLDLEDSEVINLKITVKDLSDITKIFSPFTQSFNIKATDKNKILCGFIGNEKIKNSRLSNELDSMVYISGFFYQSGKLKFEKSSYKNGDQKSFKTNFASTLTGISELLGDTTIQDLFKDENGNFDDAIKAVWGKPTLKDRLASIKNVTLSNGVTMKYGIPFISNNRVWGYDNTNFNIPDNIAYKQARPNGSENQIMLNEIRPAVDYMCIMRHLLMKIESPVICPLFDKFELKDLYVWCNAQNLVTPETAAYILQNYLAMLLVRGNVINEDPAVNIPTLPKWRMSLDQMGGVFTIQRVTAPSILNRGWGTGFTLTLKLNNLTSLDGFQTKVIVNLTNSDTGIIIDSQELTGTDIYTYNFDDQDWRGIASLLDSTGKIKVRFEILPVTLVSWSFIKFSSVQVFHHTTLPVIIGESPTLKVNHVSFTYSATNNTNSASLGGNKLNLINALPKIKCIDFLKSFFKTFNISVVPTGINDQSMYWLTPSDIKEVNKPYSSRIVDYTEFVDTESHEKESPSQYTQYSFKHADSEYYDSVYGNGVKFGSLKYPEIPPAKKNAFEVETNYSVMNNSNTFSSHPEGVKTCLGFSNENPATLPNGANRYTPVFDEFTIFYLNQKNLWSSGLSVEYTDTQNLNLQSVLQPLFYHIATQRSLAFGNENGMDRSLYYIYYREFIELLINTNTYKSEFTLTLPPNEIFLNFANLNQGESNIPKGFRSQNEIIIGELRYNLVDASINLVTGGTKITVLNV